MTLTAEDIQVIRCALDAAANGPFFEDWEFHSLFGLTRQQVRAIADAWPDEDLADSEVRLAVHGALNNLRGYPHGLEDVLETRIPGGCDALARVWDTVGSAG